VTDLLHETESYVVTGAMAAGKSTVADLLARRYERSVHIRGDVFRKMIVAGRDPLASELGPEALRQLELRRRLGAKVANEYADAGFTVVLQDIYAGAALSDVVAQLRVAPLYVVVLVPRPAVVAQREHQRDKSGYFGGWSIEELCESFERETPDLGLRLDTSDLTPDETVEEILARRPTARVR
jgi:chloramphenicol 3-O-phosphotransferase